MRVHLPKGRIRDFAIDTGTVGTGGAKLVEGLGRHEVIPSNNKDASVNISAYLRDSVHKLINDVQEITTQTNFGWKEDGSFLIGDRQIMPDGDLKIVLLSGNALTMASAVLQTSGNTKGWADAVDWIYNRPNMECMQYAICSGFGSLLGKFVDPQYNGIPLALTGPGTGRGKTTCCQIAMAAFGHPKPMTINTARGATENALYAMMSTFQNIPLLADELTNIESEYLGKLLYASSNGQDRMRMHMSNGQARLSTPFHWNMSMFMTANKHLTETLALKQVNTEAEAVRIIEIRVDDYHPPKIMLSDIGDAVARAMANCGNAGLDYIRYIVRHAAERDGIMQEVREQVLKHSKAVHNPQYRFFRNHLICTITAARIMQKLGLIKFSPDVLLVWGVELIHKLAQESMLSNTMTGDVALATLISDMAESVIVTKQYREACDPQGPETIQRIHGKTLGRYVLDSQKLYLNRKAVREWCTTNRSSEGDLMTYAATNSIAMQIVPKFHLGRGTNNAASYTDCYEIDLTNFDTAVKLLTQPNAS